MMKFCFAALAIAGLWAAPALAADTETDPRVKSILEKLPSDAELEAMKDELPDFNIVIEGMVELSKDEELQSDIDSVTQRLQKHLNDIEIEETDSGYPDINALMDEVMDIAGDKDLLADLLGAAFKVTDKMEEVMDEAVQDDETAEE